MNKSRIEMQLPTFTCRRVTPDCFPTSPLYFPRSLGKSLSLRSRKRDVTTVRATFKLGRRDREHPATSCFAVALARIWQRRARYAVAGKSNSQG